MCSPSKESNGRHVVIKDAVSMFKQYYILYEERTRMLQITVLKNVHSIVGVGGVGTEPTNVSPQLSSVLLALSQQHLAESGKLYTCVQSG